MDPDARGPLSRLFRLVVAKRWWILVFYALLLPPALFFSLKVRQDNSIEGLIIKSDPDYLDSKAFEKVFGAGEYILLVAESPDPFSPAALARVGAIEASLRDLEGIEANSALSVYRRAKGGFEATPQTAAALRSFLTGTRLFREQGLVGEGFLSIPVVLRARNPEEVKTRLAEVDRALAPYEKDPAPLTALRKIGGPYVNAYLDEETHRDTLRFFPLLGLLVLVLNLALYRSFRALAAFVATLAVAVALTMGYVGATGGTITIISPLVPMTVFITCTATLVYIHSRFVECPEGRPAEEHQIFALVNKFTACTASLFATAAGFAALAISRIRPIRDLGIWTSLGLLFTWVVVFTLFPALQSALRTPTQHERRVAGRWFHGFTETLPVFTYRWRWLLVLGSLALSAAGAVAIFGLPGFVPPMPLEKDALEYINHDTPLYKDTRRLERTIAGLSLTEVWLRGPVGSLTEPAVLSGIDRFQEALKQEATIGSVAGPTTILRMLRYIGGSGDRLPEDPEDLAKLGSDLEQLRPSEPALAGFVDENLAQTHLAVITKETDYAGFKALETRIREVWRSEVRRDPALTAFELKTVGTAPLQAKISYHLVPTLTQSFVLTVVVIFGAFLLVFRNGPARLMAMIPSLFAILVMFGVMRVTGMTLNVATILIASTVLGTSENDQIHFFYHFLERRRSGSCEESLQYTLRIAGKAIFYATMINAGGFLALAFADLPPMREFGTLASLAFVLSMLADFTALPASLWIVFREKPDSHRRSGAGTLHS